MSIPDTTKKVTKILVKLRKNCSTFSQKIVTKISEMWVQIRLGIRFSDPGVRKAPDPQHCLLHLIQLGYCKIKILDYSLKCIFQICEALTININHIQILHSVNANSKSFTIMLIRIIMTDKL